MHLIIQNVMGWHNAHMHQFLHNRNTSIIGDPELLDHDDATDATQYCISDYFTEPRKSILYEYDLGDGWLHELVFEKALDTEVGKYYPLCLEGQGNCPPEDCGGLPGFSNLVKAMKKKKGKEYLELKDWLGGDYDPTEFDLEYINKILKTYRSVDWKT